MVIADRVLREYGWHSVSPIEDAEQHIKLLLIGQKVVFASETWIASPMPTSLRAAQSQNLRWESGKPALVREYLIPLTRRAFAGRDPQMAGEAIALLLPPLSVLVALCAGFTIASVVLGSRLPATIWFLLLAGLAWHVGVG
jgi:hypothetical protein